MYLKIYTVYIYIYVYTHLHMDRISLGPGIVPVDASYKVIEGVGLSQDNELRVGEGECNGLGPLSGWGFRWISWIQRDEASMFSGFCFLPL